MGPRREGGVRQDTKRGSYPNCLEKGRLGDSEMKAGFLSREGKKTWTPPPWGFHFKLNKRCQRWGAQRDQWRRALGRTGPLSPVTTIG